MSSPKRLSPEQVRHALEIVAIVSATTAEEIRGHLAALEGELAAARSGTRVGPVRPGLGELVVRKGVGAGEGKG